MNIQQYLQRINYNDSIDLTLETLSKLQAAHLLTIPFENLDIHRGVAIDLTDSFNKIILRKRGGFCYELNGLFYEFLLQLGFVVKMVSARVFNDNKNCYGEEFDHMALIVEIGDEAFLVDVGFGEFALHPIKIEINKEIFDPRGIFKIENFEGLCKVVKKKNIEGSFIPEYIFSEKGRRLEEFYAMCSYHQTNPASHFVQRSICSLPTDKGRITLTGSTLKITRDGVVNESKLNNLQKAEALLTYFGIKI